MLRNFCKFMPSTRLCLWDLGSGHRMLSGGVLDGEVDRFGGVTVDTGHARCKPAGFPHVLEESLAAWAGAGRRCVWFRVALRDAALVPLLAQKDFKFHHARKDFVMMYKWLPEDEEANLPPASHTNLGVGCLVLDDDDRLLVVSEHHYDYPHWKLPGGYVERGEEIAAAAEREVHEETGVRAEFESLVTLRHAHGMAFEDSDLYVVVRLRARVAQLVAGAREVRAVRWMPVAEYLAHPHAHAFNRWVVRAALEMRARRLRLRLPRATLRWQRIERRITYMAVDDCGGDMF